MLIICTGLLWAGNEDELPIDELTEEMADEGSNSHALDFFAERDSSVVYSEGSGKTPNPEGGGADGWFKIYRSGKDLGFKWQGYTYDNNPHTVFVTFDSAGEYTMEVSARSSAHALDKFVLFREGMSLGDVTGESGTFTESGCSN